MDEVDNTQEQDDLIEQAPAEAKKPDTDVQEETKIPKSRFDKVNEERKALKAELDRIREEMAQQEVLAQEEQGRFKELYEKAKASLDEQKNAMKALEFDMLRKEVAAKAGYPALWARLQGKNQEELELDMQTLLEAVPRPTVPSVNGAAGTGERKAPQGKMTLEEKKEFAAVMGLRVEDVPDEFHY